MTLASYLNLDLRIGREQGRYRIQVIDSPSGQATQVFDPPFSPLELENFLLRVGRSHRGIRRLESAEMQAAKEFGGRLFDAVFAGDVRACLRSSLSEAENRAAGLRIRLHLLDAPELINVPWEFIYDRAVNRFLTLSTETPLVRYMELPERVRPLSVKPPLRILVMIASPRDYPQLHVEEEWARLQSALADLQERGLVALELVPEASLGALHRTLRRGDYHIFHFVGHGSFDADDQDGLLLMADSSGRGVVVSGQTLGMLLHDQRSLRLAVLNSCEGARSTAKDPFAGAAQTLVQQGLPAVIGMQFEISDQAAIMLSHEFYCALAEGYAVDAALGEARRALYAQTSEIEWATPVLYLRAPDGRIFDVASVAEPELRRAQQITVLMRRAHESAAAGNWAAAESEWQAVLNLESGLSDARTGYEEARRRRQLEGLNKGAEAAWQQGAWTTVVTKLEAVLKLDPGNSAAIAQLNEAKRRREQADLLAGAEAAELRQEWDLAVQAWQSVLDLAPDDERAATQLTQAKRELERAAAYTQAIQDAEAGRWQAALAGFKRLQAQSPGYRDIDACIAAAELQLADDVQRAETASRTARAREMRRAAEAAMQASAWATAVEQWLSLLKLEPADADAKAQLAEARRQSEAAGLYASAAKYLAAGQAAEALQAFRTLRNQFGRYLDVDARIAGLEAMAQPNPEAVRARNRRRVAWALAGAGMLLAIVLAIILIPRLSGSGNVAPVSAPPTAASGLAAVWPTENATEAPPTATQLSSPAAPSLPAAAVVAARSTEVRSTSTLAPPTPEPRKSRAAAFALSLTPTSQASATLTAMPAPTPTSTLTRTSVPLKTATRTVLKPSATPVKRPSATPGILVAPGLVSPEDRVASNGVTTFVWQWSGPALSQDQGFEIRLWKEGQPDHYGASEIIPATARQAQVNLAGSYGWQQGGNGRYWWTVAAVQREPYRRVGNEAPPRAIEVNISAGEGSSASTIVPPPP